jgi:hypothetical protein
VKPKEGANAGTAEMDDAPVDVGAAAAEAEEAAAGESSE